MLKTLTVQWIRANKDLSNFRIEIPKKRISTEKMVLLSTSPVSAGRIHDAVWKRERKQRTTTYAIPGTSE
ncbi:hypothetical protein Tco_0422228 [Tanacetum coccineum]